MIYNNGDILLCSGTSPISQEIKKFTDSIYSHVGLIFNLFDDNGKKIPCVIEAIQPRIAIIPLQQYFDNYQQSGKPYPGKLYLGRYAGGLLIEEAGKLRDYAVNMVQKRYDYESIIKQAFNSIFGLSLTDHDSHRLICSELVGKAYESAGIRLRKDKHDYYTPASIGRDNQIIIAELKG